MSGAGVELGTVPRGPQVARASEAIWSARRAGFRASIAHGLGYAGWGVAAIACGVLGMKIWADASRPAPRPEVHIAFVETGGTLPPALRETLPADRAELVLRSSLTRHIIARETYAWEGVRASYDEVSATSVPGPERDRYQRLMNDPADPRNPAKRLGSGPGTGRQRVVGFLIYLDKATPNAATAQVVVEITPTSGPPCRVKKVARLTWIDARALMPIEDQQRYDPAGIGFTSYASDPDPAVPVPPGCPV